MSKVLIIGAGGVGRVVVHKCAQAKEVFSGITPGFADQVQVRCHRRGDPPFPHQDRPGRCGQCPLNWWR
ncbi:MAG: saccharopine dehydrogenase NADP-binding domain-containing protein [Syntrophotaleaceae bacterium]